MKINRARQLLLALLIENDAPAAKIKEIKELLVTLLSAGLGLSDGVRSKDIFLLQ